MTGDEMSRMGSYVYCILKSGDWMKSNDSNIVGIDGSNPLFFVEYRGIMAAVSDVPLSQFGKEALDKMLNNVEWLGKAAFKHEDLLLKFMEQTTVIPIRFCTIYHNKEGIMDLLTERYEEFYETLEFLTGKEEWGVKVYLDQALLEERISATGSEFAKLDNEISSVSPGKAFFLKKKRDRLLTEKADTQSFVYADEFHRRLGNCAERAALNQLLEQETTGNPKRMILNASYLVSRNMIDGFRAEAKSIEAEHASLGLELDVSGSWPAYHFCRDMSRGGDENE